MSEEAANRTETRSFAVSPVESNMIAAAAESAGCSLSAFIREAAVAMAMEELTEYSVKHLIAREEEPVEV